MSRLHRDPRSRIRRSRELEADAAELGADAVLNLRFETSEGAAKLLAYGTAVRLD